MGHRVGRVQNQIQNDLLQLHKVASHWKFCLFLFDDISENFLEFQRIGRISSQQPGAGLGIREDRCQRLIKLMGERP
jgi:hypothetical protein